MAKKTNVAKVDVLTRQRISELWGIVRLNKDSLNSGAACKLIEAKIAACLEHQRARNQTLAERIEHLEVTNARLVKDNLELRRKLNPRRLNG